VEFLLKLVFAPIAFFAFKPVACGIVATIFTLALLLRGATFGQRTSFALAAVAWWFFCYLEYGTSIQTNIRTELVLLGPIFLILAVVAVVSFVRWMDRAPD
jgi:hypothetical protein